MDLAQLLRGVADLIDDPARRAELEARVQRAARQTAYDVAARSGHVAPDVLAELRRQLGLRD